MSTAGKKRNLAGPAGAEKQLRLWNFQADWAHNDHFQVGGALPERPLKRATFRAAAPERPKKTVTFRAKLAEIIYVEKYMEEDPAEETGLDGQQLSTTTSRLTEEMTVLSSLHGRARRHLRDIPKHDLQAAVKYGTVTPAHRCRRTNEQRWKFVYGNVVYITDDTCKKEITSYKEPVRIQPAQITTKMEEQHWEVRRILREEPQLCTTHSIIIIDQSGSMRTSDVNGFRNRSEAAFGTLALDYVAEQLYDRGDELFVDAVTTIEMNDDGSIFSEREPLDWLLFNKLLARQAEARPRSHGNYRNSLSVARAIIERELFMLAELDPEDLPAYMLVFLSDGKPSDSTTNDEFCRLSCISSLAQRLGSKLTLCAMGLGAVGSEFTALKLMALEARVSGAQGKFNHAGLSSAELSSVFSSISSAITSTRTELLTTQENPRQKTEKVYTMRNSATPMMEWPSKRYVHGVSVHRYDNSLHKAGEYPWREIPFKTNESIGFERETCPFGKGAERLAFRFYEIKRDNSLDGFQKVGKMMVAKESKFVEDDEERNEKFHTHFCRVQDKARDLSKEFNRAVKKSPLLMPTEEEGCRPPAIHFLKTQVYEYYNDRNECCGILVEKFLKGKFTKYTGNNGYVKKVAGPKIDLAVGRVFLEDFVQAFSHWVYVYSDHSMVVCDLQGVLNAECRYPRFELTDPAICTKRGRANRYGKTDLRMKGIRIFCRKHNCNQVCTGLGLPPVGTRS